MLFFNAGSLTSSFFTHTENLTDANRSPGSGGQRNPLVNSSASSPQKPLVPDRESDSLASSPSSSSMDTCSSQTQSFGKSSRRPVNQEAVVAGDVRAAGGGSFSEMDRTEEEPKLVRSQTDEELRHRVLGSLSLHGVRIEQHVVFLTSECSEVTSYEARAVLCVHLVSHSSCLLRFPS